ncbi:iron ABC transporter permease [Suttonella sp. R2A3]|uniref:ABC transporter permease n=1 Tax=Suttonella sp. R2A3 TaxID=2908648 RepID=UPI001F3E0ACD|nr:iron ABC transporter permease [Suttonella sp. R2A3]UJF23835.1 iron ABC transporter permease [Suttonella sp. R2A3]
MKSNSTSNTLTGIAKAWPPLAWGLSLLLCAPIIALLVVAFSDYSDNFRHLYDTVLFIYMRNSLILLLGVCTMAVIWGVPSAWLISRFEFPARRILRWALLLPMAMPAYLVAFVYTDLLDYAGPIQIALRDWFGWQNASDYWFVDMRTMGGAIFVLSLVFSPYVYWLVSLNFSEQSQSLIHAARLLGRSEAQVFYKVMLPLARPAIAVGCTLVGMETLADYGTVAYFSVWHMTTAVYDTWLQLFDLPLAAKLSSLLLLFVVVLITLEKRGRRHMRFYSERQTPMLRVPLTGAKAWLATAWCALVVLLGFALPALWLSTQAVRYFADTDWPAFARMGIDTLKVAFSVASMAVIIAFILQGYARLRPKRGNWTARLASLGYAIPGTVLAIGVLIVTTSIDHAINAFTNASGYGNVGLLLSGTLFAMALAFSCRFAAIGIGAVDAGMSKMPHSYDDCAYLNGYSHSETARKIWLPLLRNSLLTAFLLIFLESMKELSAALLLRPFNVELLSTYIYQYMTAERFEVAALPALLMVVIGLPPVLLLTYSMDKKNAQLP